MKPNININPMDEAYKQLSSPSGTAVSDAAKGVKPQTDMEEIDEHDTEKTARLKTGCMDINDAYAMLFESLAVIMKSN